MDYQKLFDILNTALTQYNAHLKTAGFFSTSGKIGKTRAQKLEDALNKMQQDNLTQNNQYELIVLLNAILESSSTHLKNEILNQIKPTGKLEFVAVEDGDKTVYRIDTCTLNADNFLTLFNSQIDLKTMFQADLAKSNDLSAPRTHYTLQELEQTLDILKMTPAKNSNLNFDFVVSLTKVLENSGVNISGKNADDFAADTANKLKQLEGKEEQGNFCALV